jgi:FkbM family methyltransferase
VRLAPYTPVRRRYLPPSQPFWIRPDSSDSRAVDEVWAAGTYTRRVLPHAGETWVDAGANVGAFSRLACQMGAHVVAIEAEPENHALTQRNLAGCDARCVHAALTVAGAGDFITLHVNADPAAYWRHSTVKARRKSSPIRVPVITPERIEATYGPVHGWKIDIEGAEIPLLQQWTPPSHCRAVLAEWSFDCNANLVPLRTAVDQLESAGMTVWLDRKVPWEREVWPASWQPPALMVTAWRGQSDRPARHSPASDSAAR